MGLAHSIRFARFGPFQLDLRAGELRRNGIKVRVPDQSLKVLAMLVESPGEVVTREELHHRLWPNGTIVEFDRSINAAVGRLREALEDSAGEPKFIETLPRRGYRFLVSVERFDSAEPIPASAPEPDSLEGRTVSHYRITKKLGQGGMGVVYKAEDTKLGRPVALKFLSEELSGDLQALERFEREARAASALNHPNICTVHEVGEHEGGPFIVMEYLTGKSLDHAIGPQGMRIRDVLNVAIQVSDALAEAHAAGIVHRDLKPSNVMVSREGLVKLLDFGLAKVQAPESAVETPLTVEGIIPGTLQYMSPEQLEGKEADARTDIFSLGTVIFELATGKKAFEGTSRAGLIAAIMEHEPPSLTGLDPMTPAALDRVVKKCLAKDPAARWQSARDLKDELEWIAEGAGPAARTRHPNQAQLAWTLAGLVAVIALVLAFLYFREKPVEQRAIRFSVLPPENATFGDPVAISPDGTRLALVVSTPGKEAAIWVRRLDSMTAQPLAGTEGGEDPFWSPDGRFIAFSAQGKLKKVEVLGGPVQTLCEIGSSRGALNTSGVGAWSRDGVIIFMHDFALYRVSAEGGAAAPLGVQPNQATSVCWPHFLPDGRHFLFYQFVVQGGQSDGIYAGSLDSKESTRLLDSHWKAEYAPALNGSEGYLVFIKDGNLAAQRFDANRLQLAGKPIPLTERVTEASHPAYFSTSANGALVYRSSIGAVKSQLTWFDRTGKGLGTVGLPVQDIFPSLSRDGRRLAVSRSDPLAGNRRAYQLGVTEPGDIWVLDLKRDITARLTFDSASDHPAWSPDGSHIAYVSNRDGGYNLYQRASNGSGDEELLLKWNEFLGLNDWSGDGRFLAYSSINPKTGFDLWVLPLNGNRKPFPFLRTSFSEGSGAFSPDGHWLAYQAEDSGDWEIYVSPFNGVAVDGNYAPAERWRISTDGGVFVHWRGDGKELYYLDGKDRMMAVEVKAGLSNGKPTFEKSVPKPLFDTHCYGLQPYTVTADGQRFLINTQVSEEKSQLVSVVVNWTALLH